MPQAIALVAAGRIRLKELITHRFPFERAAEAYELVHERPEETLRVVLTY